MAQRYVSCDEAQSTTGSGMEERAINNDEYAKQLPGASDGDLLRNARLCLERGYPELLKLVQAELALRQLRFNENTGQLERIGE